MSQPQSKPTYLLLLAAIAGGASFTVVGSLTSSSAKSPAAPIAAPSYAPQPPAPITAGASMDNGAPVAEDSGQVEGDILELADVPDYTYARIGAKGTEGTWVAFPSTKLAIGAHIRLRDASMMSNFPSSTLKRTFPTIWFGTLDDGAERTAGEAMAGANPHGGSTPTAKAAADVDVRHVARATGPNAKTVAEAIAERTTLAGTKVKIRAVVVKSTGGVLGHTYLHLRDGSGDAAKGNHDIPATCSETPAVGDTILVEGTLVLDRDIGSGYKFPTLLEDIQILKP